jgi:hypothetical protein
MHGVFVQVIIILLMVPLPDLVIVPDDCVKRVHHVVVPAERIMTEICIEKDLCLKAFCLSRINIQLRAGPILILLPSVEIIQRMIHRLQDMFFAGRLRECIPCDRVLKSPKLGIRIMPEGSRCPFGKELLAVIQKFLPDRRLYHILVVIQSKNLDRIGIAVQEQVYKFVKP